MAKQIRADGTIQELDITSGEELGLERLQELVGGYIQCLDMPEGSEYNTMVINEEGKFTTPELNQVATDLIRPNIFADDYIAGDVVMVNTNYDEGTMVA